MLRARTYFNAFNSPFHEVGFRKRRHFPNLKQKLLHNLVRNTGTFIQNIEFGLPLSEMSIDVYLRDYMNIHHQITYMTYGNGIELINSQRKHEVVRRSGGSRRMFC